MQLKFLDQQLLDEALVTGRLSLTTGPFIVAIRSSERAVAQSIRYLYAEHPATVAAPFSDFHVEVVPVSGPRRWLKRQVTFHLDDTEPFRPLPAEQAFPLFEWGLNWCIASLAHRWLMLHAAIVARDDGLAVAMPAPPGSGKSTLCAALSFNGWRLLSDELTMLDPESGLAYPLGRPLNVKNESIEVVRQFIPDAKMTDPVRDTKKGTVAHIAPPAASIAAMLLPARVKWVILPSWRAGAPATLEPMAPADVFRALIENAFNYDVHGEQGFELVSRIAADAEGFQLVYSDLVDALRVFASLR